MARGIKANENTRRSQVRETPVPTIGGAGAVVSSHESLFSGAEAPGVGCPDGEPDEVEEEVQHDDGG